MVVPICHTIWLHIPEDYILNNYDWIYEKKYWPPF
jgi:hypothetical protein